MNHTFQAGFVNLFGPPNSGKSTLLNALLGQRLAIVSPKVQTTRHRILAFLTTDHYQIIFSDLPGIIDPQYKLHQRMMSQVTNSVEDTDVALFLVDVTEPFGEVADLLAALKVKTHRILLINKVDKIKDQKILAGKVDEINGLFKADKTLLISAETGYQLDLIVPAILEFLPENPPFFPEDDLSDRPTKFFVSELIREQIYLLYEQEIPYHAAVLIQSFEEEAHLTRIRADIIVSREGQKRILIGKKGSLIKELGIRARQRIEEFLGAHVYLELFVKVRPRWREKEHFLREYGY